MKSTGLPVDEIRHWAYESAAGGFRLRLLFDTPTRAAPRYDYTALRAQSSARQFPIAPKKVITALLSQICRYRIIMPIRNLCPLITLAGSGADINQQIRNRTIMPAHRDEI